MNLIHAPPGYSWQEKAEYYRQVAEEAIKTNYRLMRKIEKMEEKYEGKKKRVLYKPAARKRKTK